MDKATSATSIYDAMKLIRVSNVDEVERRCSIEYVTLTNCYSMADLEAVLSEALGLTVTLSKQDYDFGVIASLILSD